MELDFLERRKTLRIKPCSTAHTRFRQIRNWGQRPARVLVQTEIMLIDSHFPATPKSINSKVLPRKVTPFRIRKSRIILLLTTINQRPWTS